MTASLRREPIAAVMGKEPCEAVAPLIVDPPDFI